MKTEIALFVKNTVLEDLKLLMALGWIQLLRNAGLIYKTTEEGKGDDTVPVSRGCMVMQLS